MDFAVIIHTSVVHTSLNLFFLGFLPFSYSCIVLLAVGAPSDTVNGLRKPAARISIDVSAKMTSFAPALNFPRAAAAKLLA